MVSDLESGRVIWLAPGHSGQALAEIFAWLGERRSERIEAAAIDSLALLRGDDPRRLEGLIYRARGFRSVWGSSPLLGSSADGLRG